MGFGLTISKMIVQQLNGEIKVVSEYNKGSNFSFEITVEDKIDIKVEDEIENGVDEGRTLIYSGDNMISQR